MKLNQLKVSALLMGALLLGACGQSTITPGGTGGDSTGGTSTPGNSTGGTSTGGTSTPTVGTSTPTSNTPNPFAFIVTFASPGNTVSSNVITVGGLSAPTTLTVTGDAKLIVNGQVVTSPVTIKNGDTVQLTTTAPSTPGDTKTITVQVAGYTSTFQVKAYNTGVTITPASSTVIEGQVVHLNTNASASLGYTFQTSCDSIKLQSVHQQTPVSCSLTNQTSTSADFSADYPGTYVINLVDKSGNVVASASVTVRDIEVDDVTATPNPVDVNQDTTLKSTLTGSSSGVTYKIVDASDGGDVSKASINGTTFSASQAGSYVVSATSNEDSKQTASTTIVVRDIQVSNVKADPNPVDINSPATLSSTVTGSNGGVTYTVTDATDGGAVGKASISGTTFTASQSGTYTITATSNDEPSKSASTTVTVRDIQVSGVTATPNPVTINSPATLNSTLTGSNGGVTYTVTDASNGGDVSKATISGTTFTASQAGVYTITATANDESSKSASTTVTVQALGHTLWFAAPYNRTSLKGYLPEHQTTNPTSPDIQIGDEQTYVGENLDVAFDPAGNLWVAEYQHQTIKRFPKSALNASGPYAPDVTINTPATALTFDTSGNLWVSDLNGTLKQYSSGNQIGGATPDLTITQQGVNDVLDIAFDVNGNLWEATGSSRQIRGFLNSQLLAGGVQTATYSFTDSSLNRVTGLAFDAVGNLWTVDQTNSVEEYSANAIYVNNTNLTPALKLSVTGGANAWKLAFDSQGNLWAAELSTNSYRIKSSDLTGSGTATVTPDATLSTGSATGIAFSNQ